VHDQLWQKSPWKDTAGKLFAVVDIYAEKTRLRPASSPVDPFLAASRGLADSSEDSAST